MLAWEDFAHGFVLFRGVWSDLIIGESDKYKIVAPFGYAPRVGELVSMMDRVRARTLEAVEGLTMAQLDHLVDDQANSIGALLLHMGRSRRCMGSFLLRIGRLHPRSVKRSGLRCRWVMRHGGKFAASLWKIEALAEIRERTKTQLREKNDAWLAEERDYVGGVRANNHYIWFHVAEDETNHRGQISWLRKQLPDLVI